MQEEARRSRQMIRDYPEIIGKLTLYLGAGMTVKRAFRKVVEEYERQKKTTGCAAPMRRCRKPAEKWKVAIQKQKAMRTLVGGVRFRPM